MSDNKKYYYLKLKDNFYNYEDMKLLESMDNGYEYSSLYLKLCLLSLKGEGKLLYKNRIPYKSKMLSTITGHSIEIIEYAISIYIKLEMLHVLDNGTIFIDDIQNLVGHGSTESERKANYRKKIKEQKLVGHCPDIRPPELELELELEKEKDIKAKKQFKKPNIQELGNYIKLKKYNIDPEQFWHYYETRDWKLKNIKMKSWQSALVTWNKNNKKFGNVEEKKWDIL